VCVAGIEWKYVPFTDNDDCVSLIQVSYTHTHTRTHTNTHTRTHTHTHMHSHMHSRVTSVTYMHTYFHTHTHIHIHTHTHTHAYTHKHACIRDWYGVATISRLLKIIGLFCRISSFLWGPFAKETYDFKEPTIRAYILTHIRTNIRMYTHMLTRTHTHTQTHVFANTLTLVSAT